MQSILYIVGDHKMLIMIIVIMSFLQILFWVLASVVMFFLVERAL